MLSLLDEIFRFRAAGVEVDSLNVQIVKYDTKKYGK